MADSLFAHLAFRFGSHPENLATDALAFILNRSRPARDAFRELLLALGAQLPDNLRWATQVAGEDSARPDLVGFDDHGAQPVLIEAKFWAGLTENQPVTYLERLPPGGVLVFVVPATRSVTIWAELRHRISEAGMVTQDTDPATRAAHVAIVGERRLALVSWRSVLATMLARTQGADDHGASADIAQLQALCDRMDTEAFLPVTSEELTSHAYRRVVEFGAIVDDVTNGLVASGVAVIKGYRSAAGSGWYGRYMRLRGASALFLCDVRKWMKYADTPLWCSVYGPNWRDSDPQLVRRALAPLEAAQPPRMFMANDGFPTVALRVPAGAERDDVIRVVTRQLAELGELIAPLATTVPSDEENPQTADEADQEDETSV